ncbi:MAG: hypothetical protein D3906_18140, partial [Candidatus Electrothrix sp. AUS1_2]|nr:hypothetical protein [Candidatus Electrothrix sp. AUS1_2]
VVDIRTGSLQMYRNWLFFTERQKLKRGEVKIGLINLGRNPYTVRRGDRIAQLILAPVCQARLQQVRELGETERGHGGFGHTGM